MREKLKNIGSGRGDVSLFAKPLKVAGADKGLSETTVGDWRGWDSSKEMTKEASEKKILHKKPKVFSSQIGITFGTSLQKV